jgi:2-hydroxychromene-2-carboxylate isomerase
VKRITFYLDFVSPYAWLAFVRLPEVLLGLSYAVQYRPVLLGALLQAHGNPGPAGIAPKRAWTYRHVQWWAQQHGVPLQLPTQHPFKPLPLLYRALACSDDGTINRYVAGTVLRHVWQEGGDALAPNRLATLDVALAGQTRQGTHADSPTPRALLRSNTQAAQEAGVFGVPAFEVDGRVLWGLDALPMLRNLLEGDAWWDGPDWDAAPSHPSGLL